MNGSKTGVAKINCNFKSLSEAHCVNNSIVVIELSFPTPVNYPLIPVKKSLVEFILTEELEGRLPC